MCADNACIGELGNTCGLPIMMINVVFETTPFWALGVYGRILKAPIPQYTAVYLEYTAVYWEYLFAPRGCFYLPKPGPWRFAANKKPGVRPAFGAQNACNYEVKAQSVSQVKTR